VATAVNDSYSAASGRTVYGGVGAPHTTFPFTLPAPGHIGTVSTNTLNSVCSNFDEQFSLSKVQGAWGSSWLVLIKSGGVVTDFLHGIFGGGHGDTANDGVYAFRGSTAAYERMLPPSAAAYALMAIPACAPTSDTTYGENIANRPDSQHAYNHMIGLNSDEAGGPALIQAYGAAVGQGAISAGQAHRFDVLAPAWTRFADLQVVGIDIVQAFVKDTLRGKFVRYPSNSGTDYYDIATNGTNWATHTQGARPGSWSATYEACAVYHPGLDIDVIGLVRAGASLYWVDASNRAGAPAPISFTGTGPTSLWGAGIMYRAATGSIVMLDTSTSPPTGVFEATLSKVGSTVSGVWSRVAMAGTSRFSNMCSNSTEHFGRPQMIDEFDCISLSPAPGFAHEFWRMPAP
jgi:hypothetical protein